MKNCNEMASQKVIANFTKEEELDGTDYDICLTEIPNLLNEVKVLEMLQITWSNP